MTFETDEQHCVRALGATRFVDADANELAALIVRTEGTDKAHVAVLRFRESRDRLMWLAACCELAACVLSHAAAGK